MPINQDRRRGFKEKYPDLRGIHFAFSASTPVVNHLSAPLQGTAMSRPGANTAVCMERPDEHVELGTGVDHAIR